MWMLEEEKPSQANSNNQDDCCKVKVRGESKGERRKGPAELELEEWKEEKRKEGSEDNV